MPISSRKFPERWDQETEVVVVGGGLAGLRAAAAACDAGASVLVLEKLDTCLECAAALSGGLMQFAGTDLQKEKGIEDTADLYYQDTMEVGEYKNEAKMVKAVTDRQLDSYYWLKEEGVEFYDLIWMPGQSVWRTHLTDPRKMVTILQRAAERQEAKIVFGTRAKRLVVSPEGRVMGVKAECEGNPRYFKARRATILACGGFGQSPDWLEKCRQGFSGVKSIAAPGATGDGLLMALDLGAELRGLSWLKSSAGVHVTAKDTSTLAVIHYCGAIYVNREGKRFMNEGAEFKVMGDILLQQPGGVGFQIFDKKIRELALKTPLKLPAPADALLIQDDTIEGLAQKIGINPATLRKTIDKYNSYVEAGRDPEFGRVALAGKEGQLIKIDTPPFYAYESTSCIAGTTITGLVTDENCHAINVFGEVIPGLYVAGEITYGFHGVKSGSGSALVNALIQGLIAGTNAAAERPVE